MAAFPCRGSMEFPVWGGRAFLHRKNAGFSPLDKMGAPSSDESDPVVALLIKCDFGY